MIQLNQVGYEIGERVLFHDLDLIINHNDRIGIVGPNGSGKTTILRIILGEVQPTRGRIERARSIEIGYLPQESYLITGRSLVDEVLSEYNAVLSELKRLESELGRKADQSGASLVHYGELQHKFDAMGGWGLKPKALKILAGLGFEENDFEKPIESFSAGWQMRVSLARMLLDEPSCLILDEPTNHLDIESIAWFEEYLDSFPGAIMLVSHDRVLMDHVLDAARGHKGILECENGRVHLFRTDFSGYEVEKESRRVHLVKAAREQQKKIGDIKKFIDKFHAHKAKARMVHSREKMLERMEVIQVEYERKTIKVRFPVAPVESKRLLTLDDVSKRYDGREIFAHLGLHIDKGEKVALIGKNGAGKSTLCRIVSGTEEPTSGIRDASEKLVISAFFQEKIRSLPPAESVLDWAQKEAPEEIQFQIRGFLGMFLFTGDDVLKKIGVLSGGEKTRLMVLASMLAESNLLLLDEPTFHLDRDSIEVLISAVNGYDGAVLLVTHDRDLIASFATRILELSHGKLTNYPGDYEYYQWKKRGTQPKTETPRKKSEAVVMTADERPEIERKLKERGQRLARLEEKFRRAGSFQDPKKVKALMAERSKLAEEIEGLTGRLNELEAEDG